VSIDVDIKPAAVLARFQLKEHILTVIM